jgi:hypothetical protein
MTTREKIKVKLDKMPDEALEKVYEYMKTIKVKQRTIKKMHTFNLHGQLDNVNIRERAYE